MTDAKPLPLQPGVTTTATFSPCGTYRYTLTRDWEPTGRGHVLWIMLNPSVASAEQDDRTVRKCQSFARAWTYDGIIVANIFALRSTDPAALYRHPDPIGPDNDVTIEGLAADPHVAVVMGAWGNHGVYRNRGLVVRERLAELGVPLWHFRLTKQRQPEHPLYIPGSAEPELLNP